ncbi:MAG: hypothetical protein ACWA5K_07515 [bacterium]
MKRQLAILTPLLLTQILVGCASLRPQIEDADRYKIPPETWYQLHYQADAVNRAAQTWENYYGWAQGFYTGTTLYRRGWHQLTDEVLSSLTSAEEQHIARDKLFQLGKLISPEWAKKNNYRIINSRHMGIWGNALLVAVRRGETLNLIDRVSNDVEAMLTGRLSPEDISASRYYRENGSDPFDAAY